MDVVDHFLSLSNQGLCGSALILGDLLLANSSNLGLHQLPDKHVKVLISYSDSLYEDLQYRRAIHYYKQALNVLEQATLTSGDSSTTQLPRPNQNNVKWKIYKCHAHLKENQEALDVLSSIPVKERDARTAMALAKLYHHYNNEKRSAVLCYKQVLSLNPLAVEAALGLLSLGVSLTEVLNATASATTNINSLPWLKGWLEAQACISKHDCKGAVVKLDTLSKAALAKDPFVLKHMDTYSRMVSSSSLNKLGSLSVSLLYTSALHPEPWIAKAWHVIKSDHLPATEKVKAGVLATKACSLSHKSAEAKYLQASLAMMKDDVGTAILKLSEAVHFDPSMFVAYEELIQCYLKVRSEREALNMVKKASKSLQQLHVLYLESLVWSHKPKTKPQAIQALEKAIKLDSTFERAPLALSNIYASDGKPEKAVEVLAHHLQSHVSPHIHCELGQHLISLRRYDDALEHFRQALRLDCECEKAVKGIKFVTSVTHEGRGDKSISIGEPSDIDWELDEDVLAAPSGLDVDSDESIPVMDLGSHDYQWM